MSTHIDPIILCDILDDAADEKAREEAMAHLRECPGCAELFETMKQTRKVLSEHEEVPLPEGFEEKLRGDLETVIRAEEKKQARSRRFVRWAAGVAAALAVGIGILTIALGGGVEALTRGVAEADPSTAAETPELWDLSVNGKSTSAAVAPYEEYDFASCDTVVQEACEEIVCEEEACTEEEAYPEEEIVEYEYAESTASSASGSSGAVTVAANSKLIYTADVTQSTYNFTDDRQSILNRISALGGYVQDGNVSGLAVEDGGYGRTAYITMRIPQESYQEMMAYISQIGTQEYVSESVQDITQDYTDEAIRLENLKAQRESLLELMEKTGSLEEYLLLQNELNDVATAIEQSETAIRNMDLRVSYATITLTLSEKYMVDEIPEDPTEPTLGERVREALYERLASMRDGFKSFVVWLVSILPVLLVLSVMAAVVLAVILIVRGAKKHGRK